MAEIALLSQNATLYFIPGFGGIVPERFNSEFNQLIQTIFGPKFKPKRKVMPNKSNLMDTDPELVKKIKDIAQDSNLDTPRGHIDLMWFCHSHGAKTVCKAYKQLKQLKEFEKIKERSAIVCIGGLSLATDDMAKVVLNVEFGNDLYAKGGSYFFGKRDGARVLVLGYFENHKCKCCNEINADTKARFENAKKSSAEFACGLGALYKESFMSVPRFVSPSLQKISPNSGVYAHLIKEYSLCTTWKIELLNLVAVDNQPH